MSTDLKDSGKNKSKAQPIITKLKKNQQAKKECEELCKNLFDNSLAGICLATLAGKIIDSNNAFLTMMAYSGEEMKGLNLKDLYLNPEDSDELVKELQRTGHIKEKEVKLKRKNGEILHVYVNISMITINGKTYILTNSIDVTGLKKAEAEIRKLQELSITDGLTGIHNRRFFDQTIEKEWRRAIRDNKPISLIMADIDFYKEYNDHYGHQQGDECLRQVAAALGSALKRPGDFLARYGGEEFAIILPGTDQKGAVQVAKNIQQKVEKMNLPHSQSTVARYVTVSMGISSIVPQRGSESSTLIGAADQALYKAKKQGRNRIITK